jgi:hypothetical protein
MNRLRMDDNNNWYGLTTSDDIYLADTVGGYA